jgi:hypothetical protein
MTAVPISDEEIAARLHLIAAVVTPTQGIRNDIIRVEADRVTVKSARTGKLREIPFRELRQADKVSSNGVIVRVLARVVGLYSGPEMEAEAEGEAVETPSSPPPALRFDEVLDAIAQLSVENQRTLIDIVRRRLHTQRRAALVKDVEESLQEFAAGQCEPRTPEEIMREALS